MSQFIEDQDVIYTNTAGTVRVRVSADPYGSEPENDGAMPTLRIDADYYGYSSKAEHVYGGREYGFDAEDAWRRFDAQFSASKTRETFRRYVRIFHGGTTFHEYNTGVSNEYGYLTFDTTAWAASVGAPHARLEQDPIARQVLATLADGRADTEELAERAGLELAQVRSACERLELLGLLRWRDNAPRPSGWVRDDDAASNFAEYEAWITGDMYVLHLEHQVRRFITTRDLAALENAPTRTEQIAWEERDSTGGVYGSDRANALEIAREAFDLEPPAAATA